MKGQIALLSTQQGIRRSSHLQSLVLLWQPPPPLLGGSWRHGEVDTSLITRNQDNSLEEQKQNQNILMKEENELKGRKKLKCFQRGFFNQKKKKGVGGNRKTQMLTLPCCSTKFDSECKIPCIIVAGLKHVLLSDNGILHTMAKWGTEKQNRSFSDVQFTVIKVCWDQTKPALLKPALHFVLLPEIGVGVCGQNESWFTYCQSTRALQLSSFTSSGIVWPV